MVQTNAAARSEAKRKEILRRAATVFRAKGFYGAGMREIAKGLGMAPGALYYYFESKEDLLYACQMTALKGLLRSAREITATGEPPETQLRLLVAAHLDHILMELGGGLAHVEFHALPKEQLDEVVRGRDAYEKLVRSVIRAGKEHGAFRDVDEKLATLAILGALNWTVVWWKPEGRRRPPDVGEEFANILIEGLKR
ncbi:MAG: TetR/AcrR family transcriptional regulator [Planctomycetota bacterium]